MIAELKRDVKYEDERDKITSAPKREKKFEFSKIELLWVKVG